MLKKEKENQSIDRYTCIRYNEATNKENEQKTKAVKDETGYPKQPE